MKISVLILILFIAFESYAKDSIKVLFLYGSKPNTKDEPKMFGGIHGGHVSIQYKSGYASFIPHNGFHYYAKKKKYSKWVIEKENSFVFDTTDSRYLILTIPISTQQKNAIDSILTQRLESTQYDYAFIGMRCASAAYEVLSTANIYPKISLGRMKMKYFYPKLLRKKMLKKAKVKHWKFIFRKGKGTRQWEKD